MTDEQVKRPLPNYQPQAGGQSAIHGVDNAGSANAETQSTTQGVKQPLSKLLIATATVMIAAVATYTLYFIERDGFETIWGSLKSPFLLFQVLLVLAIAVLYVASVYYIFKRSRYAKMLTMAALSLSLVKNVYLLLMIFCFSVFSVGDFTAYIPFVGDHINDFLYNMSWNLFQKGDDYNTYFTVYIMLYFIPQALIKIGIDSALIISLAKSKKIDAILTQDDTFTPPFVRNVVPKFNAFMVIANEKVFSKIFNGVYDKITQTKPGVANPSFISAPMSVPAPTQDVNTGNTQQFITQSESGTNIRVIYAEPNKLGIAGFILALIAVFIGAVPVIGWIIWMVGLILSIVGMSRTPKNFAVAGLVLSLVGIVIVLIVDVALWSTIGRLLQVLQYVMH
ncbi:MAG: hypothetical protein LBL41_04560 [Bifidobacteriaceae bacterium]|jgi:hypothetical protein|nr:hypothetical protein [Bifidobacteriaceae bacterium]